MTGGSPHVPRADSGHPGASKAAERSGLGWEEGKAGFGDPTGRGGSQWQKMKGWILSLSLFLSLNPTPLPLLRLTPAK